MGDYLHKRPEATEEFVQMVTGFQNIIAFRMHAQVVAASFGEPSFGLVWDPKIVEFYEKLGFPQGYAEGIGSLSEAEAVFAQYDGRIHDRALAQGEESRNCLIEAIDRAVKKKR